MIVVDANIIFSALLSPSSKFLSTLLDDKKIFIAPQYLFLKLFKHKEKLLRYSKLNEDEILELLSQVVSNIKFISHKTLSAVSLRRSYELCHDVDAKDTIFIAMTLEINGIFWTGDKKLIAGLKQKGFNRFFEI